MLSKEVPHCYLCNFSLFRCQTEVNMAFLWDLKWRHFPHLISICPLSFFLCTVASSGEPYYAMMSPLWFYLYQTVFICLLGQVIAHCLPLPPSNCLRSWASSLGHLALNNFDWQSLGMTWPFGRGKVDNEKGQKMCVSSCWISMEEGWFCSDCMVHINIKNKLS